MFRESFFNTTGESGQMLMSFTNTADAQDIIVLELFQDSPDSSFTAWEALKKLEAKGHSYLITSVRRAITTLTKQGVLVNTGVKVIEIKGRPNCKFKLNN